MKLPDSTRLAYEVTAEAWYSRIPGTRRDAPQIRISLKGPSRLWDFTVEVTGYNSPVLRLTMLQDAYPALTQVPEFFAGLQQVSRGSLAEVRSLLDWLGAEDETERERKHPGTDEPDTEEN